MEAHPLGDTDGDRFCIWGPWTQRETVPAGEIRERCKRLDRDFDDAVLRMIDDAFNAKHGRRAFG
ncbi:hypothetical protein NW757_014460 [Fusarium falciforme]|nr:hypothetical protein NW757_014460 [Fusarium falciforme]